MKCPKCGCENLAVRDSRPVDGSVRRRRECIACYHRFTTYEIDEKRWLVLSRIIALAREESKK